MGFPSSSQSHHSGEREQRPEIKIAFLALGSLGDCLPLCALAAALPAEFRLPLRHKRCGRGDALPPRSPPPTLDDDNIDEKRDDGETATNDAYGSGHQDCGKPKRARLAAENEDGEVPLRTGESRDATCTVITHRFHCGLLADLMENVFDVAEPPELYPVDLPVLYPAEPNEQKESRPRGAARAEEGRSRASGVCSELDACMVILERLQPTALVFNLYSAFGYHLAEALGIPCVCASPGVAPSNGTVALKRVLPAAILERFEKACGGSDSDKLTAADLELWMLPLFLPHYHDWRFRRGLPPLPVSAQGPLPPAPATMFGVSPAVLPRPGYWPSKANVCGCWSFRTLSPSYRPPERLVRFLDQSARDKRPVFCVGLGSMPALGLVQNASRILSLVASCLLEAGVAVILLPAGLEDDRRGISCCGADTAGAAHDNNNRNGDDDDDGDDDGASKTNSSACTASMRRLERKTPPTREAAANHAMHTVRRDYDAAQQPTPMQQTPPPPTPLVKSATPEAATAPASRRTATPTVTPTTPIAPAGDKAWADDRVLDLSIAAAAVVAAASTGGGGDREGSSAFVPHLWLLARCRGLVHHGGSGTTAAALVAGVAQVVIPIAFDQFFFAEKVEHMGVGSRVSGTVPPSPAADKTKGTEACRRRGVEGISREGLVTAISIALSPNTEAIAKQYGAVIAEENGVEIACKIIASELQ